MIVDGAGILADDTMFYAVRFPPKPFPITCAPQECREIPHLIQDFYKRAKEDFKSARDAAIASGVIPSHDDGDDGPLGLHEYIVEKITAAVYVTGVLMFRIKWLGYDEITCEPLQNCFGASALVKKFFDYCEAIENTID